MAFDGVAAVTVLPRNRGVGTVDLVPAALPHRRGHRLVIPALLHPQLYPHVHRLQRGYDLRPGTINRGELAAYGRALDGVEEELDHTAREMSLTTAGDFGLERIEALLPYRGGWAGSPRSWPAAGQSPRGCPPHWESAHSHSPACPSPPPGR